MRLPFPEQIPLRYAIYFATLLCGTQLLQGTDQAIVLCCFLFIIIATFTFNLAGGFTRSSGGYVFFYAVLAVILGITWKAVLGEQAGSNLKQPLLSFQIYLGGITAMLAAVYISQKITPKRPLLANSVSDEKMGSAATGCLVAGLAVILTLTFTTSESGSILSALNQIDVFLPLAILLGTIAQIRRSNGTSSINLTVLVAGSVIFCQGLLGFSKQGIFLSPLCWIFAAASQRYRITLYQALGFILAMSLMVYYLVPYSQYGKSLITPSLSQNLDTSISMLSQLQYVHDQVNRDSQADAEGRVQAYFDTPQGLFDRLQMIAPDDALINVTQENGTIGYMPIFAGFGNLVPHFLWPGKPHLAFGNLYAHEIGMIGEEDFSTGISFSPTGEAFHLGRWVGLFVAAPLLWIMLFVIFDSLCGDVRKYPWGLLAIVSFAHAAPESMLGGLIHLVGIGAVGIVVAAFASAHILPIIGSLVSVPERTRLRRIAPIRSIPRRLP